MYVRVVLRTDGTCFPVQHKQSGSSSTVVPKLGGTAPGGAVGLRRWALIGTRGGRERCYYHRGALVDK
jgi:hypothetical protein